MHWIPVAFACVTMAIACGESASTEAETPAPAEEVTPAPEPMPAPDSTKGTADTADVRPINRS